MIVMEGAVSRQLSAISHQPSAISHQLESDILKLYGRHKMGSTKKKGAGPSGVRLIQV
jgi:hypothetical protein